MNPFGHVWDIVVPDDRREMEQAMLFSALTGAVSLGTWAYAVVHNVPRMASHHLPSNYVRGQLSRTLLRRSARQTSMGSIARGVGVLARANPAVAVALTVVELVHYIPPSEPGSLGHEERVAHAQSLFDYEHGNEPHIWWGA